MELQTPSVSVKPVEAGGKKDKGTKEQKRRGASRSELMLCAKFSKDSGGAFQGGLAGWCGLRRACSRVSEACRPNDSVTISPQKKSAFA